MLLSVLLAAAALQSEAPPPGAFVSQNTCPLECCAYGDWMANRDVAMLDRPMGSGSRRSERVSRLRLGPRTKLQNEANLRTLLQA